MQYNRFFCIFNWVIAEVAKRNALLGSPAELHFWRTRAQSEVDLVVKQGNALQAFEMKWSPGRVAGRAFHEAYGVDVKAIRPDNPFVADLVSFKQTGGGAQRVGDEIQERVRKSQ